jgi:hypothetical protein
MGNALHRSVWSAVSSLKMNATFFPKIRRASPHHHTKPLHDWVEPVPPIHRTRELYNTVSQQSSHVVALETVGGLSHGPPHKEAGWADPRVFYIWERKQEIRQATQSSYTK